MTDGGNEIKKLREIQHLMLIAAICKTFEDEEKLPFVIASGDAKTLWKELDKATRVAVKNMELAADRVLEMTRPRQSVLPGPLHWVSVRRPRPRGLSQADRREPSPLHRANVHCDLP